MPEIFKYKNAAVTISANTVKENTDIRVFISAPAKLQLLRRKSHLLKNGHDDFCFPDRKLIEDDSDIDESYTDSE